MTPADVTEPALLRAIAHEARLLDEQRLDEWNALFTPDGWYWLPADTAHTDPLRQASHLYDDHLLREVRIRRLRSPQAHSQQAPGRCHHLLQAGEVLVHDAAANRFETRTPFVYTELRAGRTSTLPGVAWHTWRVHDGALRLALKRVDLLHAAEPLPAIEFYL
ncbi:aromatic-ring-hydroxylating dioxygenase subunit beta [Ideonella sp. A 288]|uniref:aromatic-ring-hydroxylating dioxygenase subunit beta n=1 Tax=Ideonella sp. A 288 TaxID=1962181 RepID=UPI000B4B2DE1|nr:aromatic-ring-hydroxylating dioxygenase subunit beta [Ideonella sp. A 288]